MRAVLGLVSALAFTACAQAGPPAGGASSAMPRLSAANTIELCLNAPGRSGPPESCILDYSADCIALAGELPTAAIREACYTQEREAWMARQSASLAVLMPTLGVERRGLLTDSQDAWADTTRLDCAFVASFHPHDPVAAAQGAQCQAERAAHRALQLDAWAEAYTR